MPTYHYTECGLDNVFIEGMEVRTDDHGEDVYSLPRINELHRAIAGAILNHAAAMSGKELRFLRTEVGLTQAELAKLVHCDAQTIGRWERGETPMPPSSEALIRLFIIQKLGLEDCPSPEQVSERCTPSAKEQPITIDASGGGYKLAA